MVSCRDLSSYVIVTRRPVSHPSTLQASSIWEGLGSTPFPLGKERVKEGGGDWLD